MGKIIPDKGSGEHDDFLHGVQQMYSGTKNWGSVRLTIKRSKSHLLAIKIHLTNFVAEYIEKHAFAKKYKKERIAERRAQGKGSNMSP